MKRQWAKLLLCTSLLTTRAAAQDAPLYRTDATKSKLEIAVSRAGAFKFFGHDHQVAVQGLSGVVRLNPASMENSSVRLKVEAKSLRVLDPRSSEKERREIQSTMEGEKVLNAAKFPEITFSSESISGLRKTASGYELVLTGALNLHGMTRTIRVPLSVELKDNALRARGQTSLLQTDYGITPVRVAGGTIQVKDRLKLTFDIVAVK